VSKILLSLLCCTLLFADATPLSSTKQEILSLKRRQIEKDTDVASKSWISPLNLSASINKNHDASSNDTQTQNVALQWNQDLFKSGGIESTIKQSRASGAANLLGVDIQEASYLKQIFTLKTQIMRDTLVVKQNELTLKNSEIDLMITKAKYKAGLSDLSQLNQITLTKDTAKNNLISVKKNLQSEGYELQKLIGSQNTESLHVEQFVLPTKEEYLEKNLELLQYDKQSEANVAAWRVKSSSYLPKLTLNTNYGYSKYDYSSPLASDSQGNTYSYGLTFSMPLFDVNSNNSIESARLVSLQTKSQQNDRKIELEQLYDEHCNNIKNFEAKISVADEMIKMYEELYNFTKGQVAAGFKSQYELDSLENSSKIQKLEKEIQGYNIVLEKIALYFDMKK
jgi:outer membrane protein TolC